MPPQADSSASYAYFTVDERKLYEIRRFCLRPQPRAAPILVRVC